MPKQVLSPEQEAIIDTWINSGEPLVVEASAGSGKTRVLTESVRRVIEDSPKEKFKILCLTFTNKAAEEMMERLSDVKNRKERLFIGTTHAFALEILKSRKHELGMDEMPQIIDKESDRKEILTEVILSNPILSQHYLKAPENENISLKKHQSDLLDKCLNFISRKKQKLIWLDDTTDSYPDKDWTPSRANLYRDYNALLRNQNLIDYDDILLLAWKVVSERPAVANLYQRIYKYVLVDEAQDLSFAQYELIKALCGNKIRKVLLVGDSNQAIHGYAGASSKYMKCNFIEDFDLTDANKKRINYNYRSSKAVIKIASELSGMQLEESDSYYEGKADFLEFKNEADEAEWVVQTLHQIVGKSDEQYDGELTLDKIAILGRNRFVFNELQKKLQNDEVLQNKFFLKSGTEILDPESITIKIFDLGTRVLCNERAYVYFNKLLDLLHISYDQVGEDRGGLSGITDILNKSSIDFIPDTVKEGIIQAWNKIETDINRFPEILDELSSVTNNLLEENEKALALNDIDEWREAWSKYIRSVPANAKSMSDFRRFLAMGIAQTKNRNGLTLATIHTVKGLEFHVVFLIGVGDGTFPDYRAIRKNTLNEEKNNAYVAVTRAKRELYITYPLEKSVPWGKINQMKSRFFKDKAFQNVT